MLRVEYKARDNGTGTASEGQQGKGHIGIVDTPATVAGGVAVAAEKETVRTPAEDKGGADRGRGDVKLGLGCEGGHFRLRL